MSKSLAELDIEIAVLKGELLNPQLPTDVQIHERRNELIRAFDGFLDKVAALREAKKPKASAEQRAFLQAQDADAQRLSVAFADELETAFDDLGVRAERAVATMPAPLLESIDIRDAPWVLALFAAMSVGDWRSAFLLPLFRRHYYGVGESTYVAMGQSFSLNFGIDLPDPMARRIVAEGGRRIGLVDIEVQTKRAIFDALAQARAEGLGPEAAARRIRQYIPAGRFTAMEAAKKGAGARYRAEMIARTETLHAQRVSVAEAGRDAGFTRFLAFDNRTGFGDEECTAMDGRVLSYEEMLVAIDDEHPQGTRSFAPIPGSQS